MTNQSDLRVLYLGPDPEQQPNIREFIPNRARAAQLVKSRAAEFRALLEAHFKTVAVVTPDTYKEPMSDNYDVTIFDATPLPIGEQKRMGATLPLLLTSSFARPALCIGAVTWRLVGRIGLNRKLDHL
jgi:hypothetical protein